MRIAFFLLAVLAVAACTTLPDVADGVTPQAEAADFPVLGPQDEILGAVEAAESDEAEERAALQARVAGLQNRAEALRGPVLTEADRRRMGLPSP
jgi:hypothetical protein